MIVNNEFMKGVCKVKQCNQEIRKLMKDKVISQWMLADWLGVSENTVNRWLRHELPEEKRKRIIEIIKRKEAGRDELA